MVDPKWEATFAGLAPLHQGVPDWFPRVMRYILNSLQRRDRFNLYNTRRLLGSGPDNGLNTSQLRDILQRFAGQGLRFTGAHAQKVILDTRLILFWRHFFLPACSTSPSDLSTFHAVLQAWRFDDLTANPIIKQLLLPSYRSFTKEFVTRQCLRSLFSDPEKYRQFVEWQVSQLSPASAKFYAAFLRGHQCPEQAHYGTNGWQSVCELWLALLVHPAYENRDGKIFLRLDTFKGFETPFRLAPTPPKPSGTHVSCLEPIRLITEHLLRGHAVPPLASNCHRTFPERQLDLLKEEAGELGDEIRQFIEWWQDAIGLGCIQRKLLPPKGCILTCSPVGKFFPLIIKQHDLEPLLERSLRFGLLANADEKHLTLSCLGRMFIGATKHDLEVKTVWARNVNRLSLRLGEGWSDELRRFLALVSTITGKGEYVVTPATLAKSGLKADLAILIIGGFTRLDPPRLARLTSWVTTGTDEAKKLHRVAN